MTDQLPLVFQSAQASIRGHMSVWIMPDGRAIIHVPTREPTYLELSPNDRIWLAAVLAKGEEEQP